MGPVTDFPRPSLTLVTDRNLYRQEAGGSANPLSLVETAIAGGVDIVQLRVPAAGTDDLGLYAVAMRVRELTAGKVHFVLTGDVELAEKCHADGILLPESSYKPSEARNYLRGGVRLVGAFVQSVHGASRAERGGADYVQVGPAFNDVADSENTAGLRMVRKIKDAVHIPVIAFGGIQTSEHVADCVRAGADGIAVTEAITRADNPQAAAATLRSALDTAWESIRDVP
jgi:thiamine-phosphate pyrophosphorylase